MIRGLLLDLDNTLVAIDVDAFIERYTLEVARRLVPDDPERGRALLTGATYRMLTEERARVSNRDRLMAALAAEMGEAPAALWTRVEDVARVCLPRLRSLASPLPGVRETVREARRRGLRLALATNPIYPRAVILERMRWAGLKAADVDHVASLEDCHSTKPHAAYFEELAAALGLDTGECLMVGDDADQDVPDRPTRLWVNLVAGDGTSAGRLRRGALADLWTVWADLLPTPPAPAAPLAATADAPAPVER